MKKLIAILLAVCLFFTLTACGAAEAAEEIVEEVISEVQEAPVVEEAPAEEIAVEEVPAEEIAVEEVPAEEIAVEEVPAETVDGMRPEFKAAMDSYEAFYNEYCEFMKKYMENPTDLTLLGEYADMISKSTEMNQTFEAWNEADMNDAELAYYLEVNNRVAQKLLEVAQ